MRLIKRAFHHAYHRHPDSVAGVCTYCGDKADTQDHIPPLTMVYSLDDTGAGKSMRYWLVPACLECNSILSGRPLTTITARRQYLVQVYRRRYAALLRMPAWSSDELDELHGVLREDVARHAHLSRFQRARMERLLGRRYGKHRTETRRGRL
jgi:hypothetical protein